MLLLALNCCPYFKNSWNVMFANFFMTKVDYMLFRKVSSIQEKLNSISLLIRFGKMFLMKVIDLLSALPAIPSWPMCTIGKVAYLPCT